MSGLKAITSSGGAFAHDNNNNDDDDMKVPGNTNSLFFSSWMTKFGARTQRRGSLGFNDSHIGTPPSRLDEDSNSGYMEDKYPSGDLEKYPSSKCTRLSRKRNDSYSEMTPGDDGDSFFLINKFRRNDSDSNLHEAGHSSIHLTTEGMLELDIAKPVHPNHDTHTPLPTLDEGKVLTTCSETKYAHEEIGFSEASTGHHLKGATDKKIEDNEGSIFLIDLEEMEESNSGRTILKPQSKKFSASSILQRKFAQNWFFKRSEDDTDNLVTEEDETPGKTSDKSDNSNDTIDSDKSVFHKLKTFVDKNHSKHRELNVLQPQGT